MTAGLTFCACAAVVLADINTDALEAATAQLTSTGHQVIGVSCDVADEAQAAAMVQRTVATYGRLDMAFNNAGIVGFTGDLAEESAEWEERLRAAAEQDTELAEYVRELEERAGEDLTPLSGDEIAQQFERYLRRRGGHAGPGSAPL